LVDLKRKEYDKQKYEKRKLKDPDYAKKQYAKIKSKKEKDPEFRKKYLARCLRHAKLRYKKERNKILEAKRQRYKRDRGALLYKEISKRIELIKILGDRCIKCGYDKDYRALQLDHKDGGGNADRLRVGTKIHRYYLKNIDEAKEKLQVLCANCNKIKAAENDEYNVSRRIKKK